MSLELLATIITAGVGTIIVIARCRRARRIPVRSNQRWRQIDNVIEHDRVNL